MCNAGVVQKADLIFCVTRLEETLLRDVFALKRFHNTFAHFWKHTFPSVDFQHGITLVSYSSFFESTAYRK